MRDIEQRRGGNTRVRVHCEVGTSVLGRKNSKCKGLEPGASWADLRNIQEAYVHEVN